MPFELIEDSFENTPTPLVVIIDDEFTSRVILEKIVQGVQRNIFVKAFADAITALAWIKENPPDLIIIDYLMSGMTGLEALQQMKNMYALEGVPIVIVTASEDRDIKYQALESGATDFITKPIDPYECRVRCRNMLNLRRQQKILLSHSHFLEQRVAEATRQIRTREQETLFRLAKAGEYRDEETGNHILRMAKYSRLIAEHLGLDQDNCDLIELAAPMHDIGKIGIPDHILQKPGALNPDELAIMRTHPLIGFKILQDSPSKYLMLGATIALSHHEKYDGSGYPHGTKGVDIALEARIVAVADVYDALTSNRPYKKAWSNEDSLAYLTSNIGKHFDPACVDAFIAKYSEVLIIQRQLQDIYPEY
ncbi:MAG: Response regulator receiver modulated metal dependent phosphohydrolase [Candidatus Gallionella acididurans]|uniref:Response regulator receiver modulated metal dependent phosphohydrolase n=1 Tax=Candidatus Gallionella acididurans TaxID=1796491 RepID=A0A139BSN3_9PROT|nr:MAG: Response regulator receiver modulated metal dependent phosphohydrolase [Candidatus Gallionella acididurans]